VAQSRIEDISAHRAHRHRSARFECGVRRGVWAAVECRRRARPLQDHRRRRHVESSAGNQREHGR
jgi:hypothetical protein